MGRRCCLIISSVRSSTSSSSPPRPSGVRAGWISKYLIFEDQRGPERTNERTNEKTWLPALDGAFEGESVCLNETTADFKDTHLERYSI